MYRHPETKHIKAKYQKDYNQKPKLSQNLVDKIREMERKQTSRDSSRTSRKLSITKADPPPLDSRRSSGSNYSWREKVIERNKKAEAAEEWIKSQEAESWKSSVIGLKNT